MVFHPDMARELGEAVGLERELREALKEGEFGVHYQPEINPASGQIVGVEALARWHSPSRGLVMPDDFIPIAESSGLIHEIGSEVLRRVRTLERGKAEVTARVARDQESDRRVTEPAAAVVEDHGAIHGSSFHDGGRHLRGDPPT